MDGRATPPHNARVEDRGRRLRRRDHQQVHRDRDRGDRHVHSNSISTPLPGSGAAPMHGPIPRNNLYPRSTSVPPPRPGANPADGRTSAPPRQIRPSFSNDQQNHDTNRGRDPSGNRGGRDQSATRDRDRDIYNDPVRRHLRQIARSTIDALDKGYVDEPVPGAEHVLRHNITRYIVETQKDTILYADNAPELVGWRNGGGRRRRGLRGGGGQEMQVDLASMTTLQGARYLGNTIAYSSGPQSAISPSSVSSTVPKHKIGVLNFASATKPGGGFLSGARAQEESIARSSSLPSSLYSPAAQPFYDIHKKLADGGKSKGKGGYYTHMMIYSPSVLLFRDDDGAWVKPLKVEVVTSPAVNAGEVRKYVQAKHGVHPSQPYPPSPEVYDQTEGRINEVMLERMGRVLALFEGHGIRHLVLGSFGTGVFQNDVEAVAGIWRELLKGSQARFKDSFDTVIFAIPDVNTLAKFRNAFGM